MMPSNPRLPAGVRRIFRLPWSRAGVRRDLDDEVRSHLGMRIDDLRARGMTESDARAEAQRRFGDTAEFCASEASAAERTAR